MVVKVGEDVTCFSSQRFLHSDSPLLQLPLLLLHLLQLPLDDLEEQATGVVRHRIKAATATPALLRVHSVDGAH